jgi:hypothetical protein
MKRAIRVIKNVLLTCEHIPILGAFLYYASTLPYHLDIEVLKWSMLDAYCYKCRETYEQQLIRGIKKLKERKRK